MRKILISLLVISLTIVLIGGATFAYFHDEETSAGNTFTASTLDLLVDGKNDPDVTRFVFFSLAPSRNGTMNWTLKNDGKTDGFLDLENVTVLNSGGAHPEPERAVDPLNNGSLGSSMNIVVHIGAIHVYTGTLNGFAGNHNVSVPLAGGATTNVTIDWNIPHTVGNKIQGDIANVSITFELAQTAAQ